MNKQGNAPEADAPMPMGEAESKGIVGGETPGGHKPTADTVCRVANCGCASTGIGCACVGHNHQS